MLPTLDVLEQPSIHCTGLSLLPNVTARLILELRFADCHSIAIALVDDKGTDEPEDDNVLPVEFDQCISRRDIITSVLPLDTILYEIAEVNREQAITEDPGTVAWLFTDIVTELVARSAALDITHIGDDDEVLLELQCGLFKAQASLHVETAREFFIIDEPQIGGPIPGDQEEPIEDLDDDDVNHALQVDETI